MKDIIYTRKYTDLKGQEHKEYITIGYMFEKDGRLSILMKSWINPAALANEKGEVWLNVFEHKSKTQNNDTKTLYKAAEAVNVMQSAVNQTNAPKEEISEDLPF